MIITQEELKALLDYDEDTGVFTWKVYCKRIKVGQRAGTVDVRGYRYIQIKGKVYGEHRLVWLYCNGTFPVNDIDHIDGVKSNNVRSNLRVATRSENLFNRGKYLTNSSGFKGVHWAKAKSKWNAQATLNGVKKFLGYFNTPEEASQVYQEFALKNHGAFIHQSVVTGLTT